MTTTHTGMFNNYKLNALKFFTASNVAMVLLKCSTYGKQQVMLE